MEPPRLMGVLRQTAAAGRPSAVFHVTTSMSSAEVEAKYREGGTEADESTAIVFCPAADHGEGGGESKGGGVAGGEGASNGTNLMVVGLYNMVRRETNPPCSRVVLYVVGENTQDKT